MSATFEIGERVRSKPVGKAAAFVGTVAASENGQYIVRDYLKRRWIRAEAELERAP